MEDVDLRFYRRAYFQSAQRSGQTHPSCVQEPSFFFFFKNFVRQTPPSLSALEEVHPSHGGIAMGLVTIRRRSIRIGVATYLVL